MDVAAQIPKCGVLLRHDLDIGLDLAFEMAKLEKAEGIRSTYFVMVSNPLYNVRSKGNIDIIRWLADNDFNVGLHFDPSIYETRDADGLIDYACEEARILSGIAGRNVNALSFHMPSKYGMIQKLGSFQVAYDERYFNDAIYMSDSQMSFRHKKPYEFIHKASERLIQILLHPFFYSISAKDAQLPDLNTAAMLSKLDLVREALATLNLLRGGEFESLAARLTQQTGNVL